MTASRVYRHLATEASLRGIDPERFRRAEAELRREEMRRVLWVVGEKMRTVRKATK